MSELPSTSSSLSPNPGDTPSTRWRRFESLLDRASDRLNPILVKEARQAMKSRQFVITFALVLAGAWCCEADRCNLSSIHADGDV